MAKSPMIKIIKTDIWTREATPEQVARSEQNTEPSPLTLKVEEVTEIEFQKRQYQDFVAWGRSRGFEPNDPRNYLPTPTESQVLQEADMKLHPEKYEVKNG